MGSSLEDYAEIAVGFGYTALFVAALPVAALCYWLYSTLQIKGDGWKLLHLFKRPFPRGCEDIGTWYASMVLYMCVGCLYVACLLTTCSRLTPPTHNCSVPWLLVTTCT